MSFSRFRHWLGKLPVHIILILVCLIWILPTLGLLITSFRPVQAINQSGWWTVLAPAQVSPTYGNLCADCHGLDGKALPAADLSNPDFIAQFRRSSNLLLALRKEINGQPHMGDKPLPTAQEAADILTFLRQRTGTGQQASFTLDNYTDALFGYRGTSHYRTACAEGTQSVDLRCDWRDLFNKRGMGLAFLNSLGVAIPSTLLPIMFAAFAGYALSWLHFRGRFAIFVLLVALQIVPLQMTLIPVSRAYTQLGLNGTFLGVWLFHTGFGLPYAVFLMRNFLGSLPRELFESAYLDGASHWTAFLKLAIPLSIPAIASLGIFQFLWIWNDLLVALVFLGAANPVLTYQIANMVTSLGSGWQLLTAAAFISMALPMVVFFALQRFFVRGLLAGAVKG